MASIPSRFNNYQSQEKDEETGFLNFDLRQYDARIGRWFNPDPMGQCHSPYLAMGNNPISMVDPSGGQAGDGGDDNNIFNPLTRTLGQTGSNSDWWWRWNSENYFSLSLDLYKAKIDSYENYSRKLHEQFQQKDDDDYFNNITIGYNLSPVMVNHTKNITTGLLKMSN